MNKQYSKRMFANLIFYGLVCQALTPMIALADVREATSSSSSRPIINCKQCPCKDKSYDYVIIGAGTAGCVLAYELSNDKTTKVLVLEGGPNLDLDPVILNIDFPAGNISTQAINSSVAEASSLRHTYYYEWFTIPMPGTNTPPVQNRPILYGGARCAGGTSATNGMLHLRPSFQALDNWVDLTGDEEYGMGFIPFGTASKMTERWVEINTYLPADPNEPELYWHGYGTNPDQINTIFDRQQMRTNGGSIMANAFANFTTTTFGLPWTPNVDTYPGPSLFPTIVMPMVPPAPGPAFDRNNPNYPYHTTAQVCIEQRADRTRSFSSREFLLSINGDEPEFPNVATVRYDAEKRMDVGIDGRLLNVLYDSTVLNIQWDKHVATAKSVTYLRDGVCHKARIKEGGKLILSAGINSAAILLKNGVGPVDELIAAGIDVIVANDQVGKNIQNHPIIVMAIAQNPIDGVVRTVSNRARSNNIATLTLNSVAGLATGDWLNISGVGGTGDPLFNPTGYNANNVQIASIGIPTANDITYYNVGPNEASTVNNSTSTGTTPSSRVIKVDQFRAGANSQVAWMAKMPYGWDGLNGGVIDPTQQAKWSLGGQILGNNIILVHLNPAARGFIQVINDDPLHPVQCDLNYLARPSDITDYIAGIRRMVNVIDYLRSPAGGNNQNYDIGAAPNRATIRGTAAPAVVGYQRTNGIATLTFASAPNPALSVGGFITVGDTIAPTTSMPDPSFNSIGAQISGVGALTVSYANPGPNVAFTAINPRPDVVLDQSALVTFIRQAFAQNHHFQGSCQMREFKEQGGVVDAFGNVFDTTNVMVCDASAFPVQCDANLAGTVYPFALKIAQDLLTGRNPLS